MNIYQKTIAYNSILRREILRIIRIWPQTICPSIISAALNMLVFGKLIGSQISQNQPYIHYIIPGLILMAIIMNSYENTVSSFFVPKYMRSIEELLISPTPSYIIILAYASGGVARSITLACFIYLASMFFTSTSIINFPLLLIISLLTAIIFAIAGLINAFLAKNFDDIAWFSSFILTPMIFFAGLYYKIERLDPIWQNISLFNPLYYILQIFRSCFFEVENINVGIVVSSMCLLVVVLFKVAMRLLDKTIRK
ncbi:Inner membrane transport permease YadH [Candidatus Arcanobacter lacustris]|uniref:Transport permease protein n=1 Tax=Candidatus Arcanibacter lacustris TaxID=1607817 RepID=A0A0F5MNN3_9RICK|nr:Inner membrane transport permease YadH [Candidatus Arcanobacter lacustris]